MIATIQQANNKSCGQEAALQPDRRQEARLKRHEAISFRCDGFLDLRFGWMVDLCSKGVGFLVAMGDCPKVGEQLWLRISDLLAGEAISKNASSAMAGRVIRSDEFSGSLRRIAVEFIAASDHKPSETAGPVVVMSRLGPSTSRKVRVA